MDYNKTFATIKKTAGNKLIAWNSFHTLMGKIDMKDAAKIWEQYKKEIAGTSGNVNKIDGITAQYVKKIESLGGNVKSLGSKPRAAKAHVHHAHAAPGKKEYTKTHQLKKAADKHALKISKRGGKVRITGNKLTYWF